MHLPVVLVVLAPFALSNAGLARGPDPSADIEVRRSVHNREHPWPGDERPDGPIRVWERMEFVYEIENHGPDSAEVEFRLHLSPAEGEPGWDFWSTPVLAGGIGWEPGPSDACDRSLTCRLVMHSSGFLRVRFFANGNAPGTFNLRTEMSSSVEDPDPANSTLPDLRYDVLCSVMGTSGRDTLRGTSEEDSICGLDGDDELVGVGPGDRLIGGPGDDLFRGNVGGQYFVGGPGYDTADYSNAHQGVSVDLEHGGQSGWGHDILVQIEGLVGSDWSDYLEGGDSRNRIVAGGGEDRIRGGSGRDLLRGGNGDDEFASKDGSRDILSAAEGFDVGHTDPKDRTASLVRVGATPFRDRDIGP